MFATLLSLIYDSFLLRYSFLSLTSFEYSYIKLSRLLPALTRSVFLCTVNLDSRSNRQETRCWRLLSNAYHLTKGRSLGCCMLGLMEWKKILFFKKYFYKNRSAFGYCNKMLGIFFCSWKIYGNVDRILDTFVVRFEVKTFKFKRYLMSFDFLKLRKKFSSLFMTVGRNC